MVGYFEIPVIDLERAMAFYGAVFDVALELSEVDGNRMAHFPDADQPGRISGALATGESYRPSPIGTLVYFSVADISTTLYAVEREGGSSAYPQTHIGEWGYVAEFIDSEGNRVGLSARC